jgi:predicted short-subunit dehydrogenase-like oxidoreductase (DUF2520 family)
VALRAAGVPVVGLHGRRRKRLPRGLRLTVGGMAPWLDRADVVLLAVQDDSLEALVRDLAGDAGVRRGQVVLHLSGVRSSRILAPLSARGASVGGLHPLMTAMGRPAMDAGNLRRATFAVEGSPRALRAARALVRRLGAHAVRLKPAMRGRYHAGAVFAANYVVTMLAVAEDLLVDCGFSRRSARTALVPLTGAALANSAANGPARALTGPIVRGDAATIRLNLAALDHGQRELYRAAGKATLAMARRAGRIGAARAAAIGRALRGS